MNVDKVIASSKVIANLTQSPMKILAESVLLNELKMAGFRHLVSIPALFGMQTSGGTLYAATSGSILPKFGPTCRAIFFRSKHLYIQSKAIIIMIINDHF